MLRLRWITPLLIGLMSVFMPVQAQDSPITGCDPDTIKTRINESVVRYAQAEDAANDTEAVLQAAQALTDDVGALIEECGNANAETGTGILTEGRWLIQWDFPAEMCGGIDLSALADGVPVIITVDGDNNRILIHELFTFGMAEFTAGDDGTYSFLFNRRVAGGNSFSSDNTISSLTPTNIEGTTTDYYSWIDCSKTYAFHLELVDAAIMCIVGSPEGANLRSGPGTTFDRLGALNAGEPADVIGQATGSDGFVWWRLDHEAWVRSDLVSEAGACEAVPSVST